MDVYYFFNKNNVIKINISKIMKENDKNKWQNIQEEEEWEKAIPLTDS